jgi:mRNA interferase MazF
LRHPYVVIQNDVYNASRIETVVVCSLTSKLKRAQAPGNVLLEEGEANLPKPSVMNVSQLYTLDKSELVEKVGSLRGHRVRDPARGVNAAEPWPVHF